MSRIRELKITDQLFDRELPKDFSIIPAYKEEYNTPKFVLHFSEKIAYKEHIKSMMNFKRNILKN